jgi:hypothetical protein
LKVRSKKWEKLIKSVFHLYKSAAKIFLQGWEHSDGITSSRPVGIRNDNFIFSGFFFVSLRLCAGHTGGNGWIVMELLRRRRSSQ